MTDFKSIEYLKYGNERQVHAYSVLIKLGIFDYLSQYNPILTGTIPIEIDWVESDLDIICHCENHAQFTKDLKKEFSRNLLLLNCLA